MLRLIAPSDGPTVRETFAAAFRRDIPLETLQRIHRAPALAETWRKQIMKRIHVLTRE